MTKIAYQSKRFSTETFEIINTANDIISDYEAQGYVLTLRQLYYQFVARGFLANNERNYDRLGSIINDARLAGYIDWESIVDRTRGVIQNTNFESPVDLINYYGAGYRKDFWKGQTYRPEVWIEKNALIDVVSSVCSELDVPHFATVGYNSQTEMWTAGQRCLEAIEDGYKPVILYFGDHDPSGIDMTRDVEERLSMFVGRKVWVARLALNMEQIDQYQPPPNPAKTTDSRFRSYIERFGDESWELDALEPQVIADITRRTIEQLIDRPAWDKVQEQWKAEQEQLLKLGQYWAEIENYIGMRSGQ